MQALQAGLELESIVIFSFGEERFNGVVSNFVPFFTKTSQPFKITKLNFP
jgi:hypothetical protein